jgi:hypothetical protein
MKQQIQEIKLHLHGTKSGLVEILNLVSDTFQKKIWLQ